jgi:N-acetylmuramoyl-L-alanine amidase
MEFIRGLEKAVDIGLIGTALSLTFLAGSILGKSETKYLQRNSAYKIAHKSEIEKIEGTNYKTKDFSNDSDRVLLARMIFGEARGCSEIEKIAVAYTAMNRLRDGKKWNGERIREVILCPFQYSCFNSEDKNREKLMNPESGEPEAWKECLKISERVLSREISDPTKGATHYFNPEHANPNWKDSMRKIGKIKTEKGLSAHEFYQED